MTRHKPRSPRELKDPPWWVTAPLSPLADAMADQNYRQAVAARSLNQPPPPQEPPVTAPIPSPVPRPSPPLSERLERLEGRMASLETDNSLLRSQLNDLESKLGELEAHTANQPAEREALNQKIISFLESMPGIKFSAVSVAENLGLPVNATADRMRNLATKGRVQQIKQDNRHPLYFAYVK